MLSHFKPFSHVAKEGCLVIVTPLTQPLVTFVKTSQL
jgi:hypothetical protein